MAETAGYSGTPLVKKLGIKEGHRVALVNAPPELLDLLGGLPPDVALQTGLDPAPDVSLAFFTEVADLHDALDSLAAAAFPDRSIWLAWPKKAPGVATDLTGDVVRGEVLATKLVDVKICAISDVWSGQKVMWRKEHRKG
jgi:hypothetical protein